MDHGNEIEYLSLDKVTKDDIAFKTTYSIWAYFG